MTHTKNATIKHAFERYANSNLYTLRDCYAKHSTAKENAYHYCIRLYLDTPAGRQPRIIGYNSMTFSFGFIGKHNGKDAFFYITRDYDRFIYLDEIEV